MPRENDPWFKCFTQTYLRDDKLKSVSLAAEGLHARMMNLCWLSDVPGFLVTEGRASVASDFALEKWGARYTQEDVDAIQQLMEELAEAKRIVWDEERLCYYIPKQRKQAEERAFFSKCGKKGGGNPKMKGGNRE